MWGVSWGSKTGAVLAAWAIVLFLIRGAAPFEARGTTLGAVVVLYLAGGTAGGVIVGLFLPLARTGFGAAIAGTAAFVAVATASAGVLFGFATWSWIPHMFCVLVGSPALGVPIGLVYREIFRNEIQRMAKKYKSSRRL
jgi:hypothetical protein